MTILDPKTPDTYLVRRTSIYGDDDRPCDEAFLVEIPRVDTRGCDDPKKIPFNKGTDGDWYMKGSNHRVENGMIRRDMGVDQAWAVKTDPWGFIAKYGTCVVNQDMDGYKSVEIYDTYRE